MLNIEEFKKACKFADGFEWTEQEIFYLPNGKHYLVFPTFDLKHIENWNCYVYPLFLQRVVEGMNRQFYNDDFKYFVETSCNELNVVGTWGHPNLQLQFDNDYDQAKEQAIKYILEQIK